VLDSRVYTLYSKGEVTDNFMKVQDFTLNISGGKECDGGYVEVAHSAVYSLTMTNASGSRAKAEVWIDGLLINTWILPSGVTSEIKTPTSNGGCFTFFAENTPESLDAGIIAGDPNNGRVKVVFVPQKIQPLYVEARRNGQRGLSFGGGSRGASAGGTGLTGQSSQSFGSTHWDESQEDWDRAVEINLKLIEAPKVSSLPGRKVPKFSNAAPI
jgi:hypothetical protein